MRAIYGDASNVISWLGPSTEETDRLFIFFRNHHYSCTTHDGTAEECGFTVDPKLADALRYLEEWPYWHRIWVIQEIVVATSLEVMCGDESVMWSIFVKFWPLIFEDHFKKPPGMNRRLGPPAYSSAIISLLAWRRSNIDLSHALELTGLSCATDGRDKVYALLGLVDRGASQHIVVDYTVPACTVFLTTTQAIIDDWSECNTDESKQEKLEYLLSQINTEPSSRQRFKNFCAGPRASPIPECSTIAHLHQQIRFLLGNSKRPEVDLPNNDSNCDGEVCGSWAAMYKAATIQKYSKHQISSSYKYANQNAASVTSGRELKSRRGTSRNIRSNMRRTERIKKSKVSNQVLNDTVQAYMQDLSAWQTLH